MRNSDKKSPGSFIYFTIGSRPCKERPCMWCDSIRRCRFIIRDFLKMWRYFVQFAIYLLISSVVTWASAGVISSSEEDQLPKEILDCLEKSKVINPKIIEFYDKCAKTLGYNMDDFSHETAVDFSSKSLAVESCVEEVKAKDKDLSTVVNRCNDAVRNLSSSQKSMLAQIIFNRDAPLA